MRQRINSKRKGSNERAAAKDLMSHGQIWKGANTYLSGLTDTGLSAIPLAGPAINSIAERFERGDRSGAATDLVAALAMENMAKRGGYSRIAGRVQSVCEHLTVFRTDELRRYFESDKTKHQISNGKDHAAMLEERPIALTRKGLAEKAAGRAEEAGQQIEQTVSGLQGTMNTQPVIDGLQNLKKSFQVNGVSLRPEVDNAIDAVSQQMQAMGPDISLQDAVKARRILDSAVSEAKGYQGAQLSNASMAAIRTEAANSIRSEANWRRRVRTLRQ